MLGKIRGQVYNALNKSKNLLNSVNININVMDCLCYRSKGPLTEFSFLIPRNKTVTGVTVGSGVKREVIFIGLLLNF